MKRVRIITSLLLVIAVMLSLIPLTLADDPATEPTEQPIPAGAPKVEIVGATIKNDDEFFEVGVKVSPENNGFLSTGVVLEYDRRLLVPVAWDKEGTEAVGADRTSWTQVASVPALCPSEISGKTAFAYNDKEDPNKGYLYLSAEAPVRLEKDKMPTGNVITVRFRYAGSGDTPEEQKAARQASKAAIMAKVGDPEPANTDAPTGTEAPATTDAPEVTEEPTNTEAPQGRDADEAESTEAPTGTEEPANTETPTGTQTPTATDAPDKFATGEGAIRLAPDEIAADSPAGQQVMYCTGDTETDSDNISDHVVEYYYTNVKVDESKGIKYDHPMQAPTFSLVEIEAGSNAGSASAADFASLVFFDWDGKTMLGSVTVKRNSDSRHDVEEFENALRDLTLPEGELYSDKADKKLTNKKGYTFEGVWIDFYSDLRTHYGVTTTSEIIEKPESVDFASINDNMLLKAVYGSNKDIATGSALEMFYTTSVSEYNRFGTATTYSATIKAKRENTEGRGVPRTGTAAMRVTMTTTADASITLLYNMDNVDDTTVEVAAGTAIKSIQAEVIDIYGVSNWVGAGARNDPEMAYQVPTNDKPGFRMEGTARYISDLTEDSVANGTRLAYAIALINNASTGMGITTTGTTIANIRTAITAAWMAKNGLTTEADYKPGTKYQSLTASEIEDVVLTLRGLK